MKPALVFVEIWGETSGVHLRGWWPANTLVALVEYLKKLIEEGRVEEDYEI